MPTTPGEYKTVVYTFKYDFATHGGAVGAITLDGEGNGGTGELPDNAIVTRAWLEPITDPTSSGSATIMLGLSEDTDAFLAATAYNHASFVAPEPVAINAAVPQKIDEAAGNTVVATIATAALTAGKFYVHVEMLQGA